MIALIKCKVCCLLNFAHDRGSSTEGWICIVHIVHTTVYFCTVCNKFITLVQS